MFVLVDCVQHSYAAARLKKTMKASLKHGTWQIVD